MTNQDVFVLGVGAQKAGTSWLHWYLQKAPNVDCGPLKEYHVWDALLESGAEKGRLAASEAAASSARQRLRYSMQQDTQVYFDYFADRLTGDGITVTADITPLYAILPRATFQHIGAEFARRGIHVKTVFLMRDPLSRCWSQVRMNHRRQRNINIDFSTNPSPEDILAAAYQERRLRIRTEYHKTLEVLEAAFDPADIHYGFYETMFSPQEVARLSDFLGVASRPKLVKQRVNANPAPPPLSDKTARAVVQEYREVYEVCGGRWPELREIWPGFAYL